MEHLTSLTMEHLPITDAALGPVLRGPHATRLTVLRLNGCTQLTDVSMAAMAGLANLRVLGLGGTRVASLSSLRCHPRLLELNIGHTLVLSGEMVHLSKCPCLSRLVLKGLRISPADVRRLAGLTSLSHLILPGRDLDDEWILALPGEHPQPPRLACWERTGLSEWLPQEAKCSRYVPSPLAVPLAHSLFT